MRRSRHRVLVNTGCRGKEARDEIGRAARCGKDDIGVVTAQKAVIGQGGRDQTLVRHHPHLIARAMNALDLKDRIRRGLDAKGCLQGIALPALAIADRRQVHGEALAILAHFQPP